MAGAVHLYSPAPFIGRGIHKCTTCRARKRALFTYFEWYESEKICGGCGYKWIAGYGRQPTGKRERNANVRRVKNAWAIYECRRDALRRLMKHIEENRRRDSA